MARDRGAQSDILIGLEHGAHRLHGLKRELEDVVGEKGDAGLDRVHGAQRGAQIDHPRGELGGAEDAVGEGHPQLERQIVVAPLGEGLRRVDVTVDEARDYQLAAPGDHALGPDIVGDGADADDAVVLDQYIALEWLAAMLRVHRDDGGTAYQYRHALGLPRVSAFSGHSGRT